MAEGDKKVQYDITGDASGFVASMERAAGAADSSANKIKAQFDGVGKAFEHVQSKLLLLASVVAGGAFFKEAIAESNKLTGEALKLSKRLDITGESAAALNTALGDIYTDSDTYIGAFDQFAKQLKKNEAGLQAMGLQTRDTNGNIRDSNTLFTEALQAVGAYKPGLDQTTAAMTLFGKGVDDVMKLQKLNTGVIEEAQKKNQALGLTISQEGVAASKAYKAAMNDVGDVMTAVKNTIGQAVMPVFTELGNYFAESGPYVVNVFKFALSGLLLVFRGVQMAVKVFANIVFEAISTIADSASLLGDVFNRLLSGDFSGAVDSAKSLGARIGQGYKRAYVDNVKDAFAEAQAATQVDAQRVWGDGTAVGKPKGGTQTMGDFGKTNANPNAKEKTRMAEWEAVLSEDKLAYTEQQNAQGSFAQFTLQQEAAFWRARLALTTTGSQENLAVRRKLADLQLNLNKESFAAEVAGLHTAAAAWKNNTDQKLAILDQEAVLIAQRFGAESKEYEEVQKRIVEAKRQAADQLQQIDQVRLQSVRNAALAEVATQEQAAQLDLQLGLITQAQLLAMQANFEQQRYDIAASALQARLQLMQADPDNNPVALAQLQAEVEALEQQHQARLGQIRSQMSLETSRNITSTLATIQNDWANLITQLMKGTVTIGGFVKGIFQSIAGAVIQTLASMVAKWLVQKALMLIFGKSMAGGEIATEAAKAGAGGVASMAAAPYPFNLSAPFFGAAMAAAAGSYAAVASASQGYDIPSGVNPMTQLHAREMVLPAQHADVIRGLSEGGSSGAPVHIHGDPSDTVRLSQMGNVLRQLGHQFEFVRGY